MQYRVTRIVCSSVAILVVALAATGIASANAITYVGSSGNLSAQAVFSLTGNDLTVTLTNTSTADVLLPTDVLTGVFFNLTAGLTPVSASDPGSTPYYGPLTNVGDGWGFATGVNANGKNSAISATGAVSGLGQSNFSSNHTNLDGLAYGLLSAGDNSSTGNGGVLGHGPLIKDSAQFVLTAPEGFNLSELGNTVVFQYGTSLDETHYNGNLQTTPEPATLAMLGSGAIGLAAVLRRKYRF